MILRDFQLEGKTRIMADFAECGSTLLLFPTGTGKTPVMAVTIDEVLAANPGKRALVVVHTEELCDQMVDKILKWTNLSVDVEMGKRWGAGASGLCKADVLVASRQTLNAGFGGYGRKTRFDPDEYVLLMIDEAHHATAKSYRDIIAYFHCKFLLGVTATADRADEESLGQIFKSVAMEYGLNAATDDGWLVPIESNPVIVDGLDFSEIKTTKGDLNGADLERQLILEEPLQKMIQPTMEIVGTRKALIFAAGVEHARLMTEIVNRERPGCARYVTGKTPKDERRQLFIDYREGKFNFLINVGVTAEGWDEPTVEVVVLARPSKSRALVAQQIGRGTRPEDGLVDRFDTAEERRNAIAASSKPFVEILDLVGNCGRHRLITPVDILGGNESDAVCDRAKELCEAESKKTGKPVNVQDVLSRAKRLIQQELEESRRKNIRAKVTFHKTSVDMFGILDMRPCAERGWDKVIKATEKQLVALRNFKIPIPSDGFSKKRASQLLDELCGRIDKQLCTYKQAKYLQRQDFNTKGMTKEVASALIGTLMANKWQRPKEAEVA